jgi:hypothetical protein
MSSFSLIKEMSGASLCARSNNNKTHISEIVLNSFNRRLSCVSVGV